VNLHVASDVTTPENADAATERGKDLTLNIPTKWHSRTVELAAPFNKATLQRVIIDYAWQYDGSTGTEDGPTVALKDGQGNTIGSTWLLPSADTPFAGITSRQRHVHDVFEEISELSVRIEYAGTARFLSRSEIYDVFIEYMPAYERR